MLNSFNSAGNDDDLPAYLQIIIVVFDNWEVQCFNHRLQLLWRRQLMDVGQLREAYTVKAMGVLIAPVRVERGDQGVVIVGGSFEHREHLVRCVLLLFIESVI